jgi:pentatricopeptide repeat protein
MAECGLAPNHITYGTLINAMAKRGSARDATALLKQMMASDLQPTLVAFNSVLHAHARGDDGSAAEALVLLQSMKEYGLTPNTISYSSCIDAQAKKPDGSAETAAQLLECAVAEGVVPDKVMFTAVFDAQAKRRDGSPMRAAALLEMMSTSSWVSPNEIHFNAVMNACASARPADITTAKRVLCLMTARFKPNEYTLSAMLRCATFSSPPEPETAEHLFHQYGAGIRINDHIERALRGAVSDHVADDLFMAIGHTPTTRRRRRNGGNNNNNGHPHNNNHGNRRKGGGGGPSRNQAYEGSAVSRGQPYEVSPQIPPQQWGSHASWRPFDEPYSSMGGFSGEGQQYSPPMHRSGLNHNAPVYAIPTGRSTSESEWSAGSLGPSMVGVPADSAWPTFTPAAAVSRVTSASTSDSPWPTFGTPVARSPNMQSPSSHVSETSSPHGSPRSSPQHVTPSGLRTPPGLIHPGSPWATFGKKSTLEEPPSAFNSTLMTARRLSLSSGTTAGGSRRGSLAGSAALEVASFPRLTTQAVSGIAAALSKNEEPATWQVSPPSRRKSLAEKVANIKACNVDDTQQSQFLDKAPGSPTRSAPGSPRRVRPLSDGSDSTASSDCISVSPPDLLITADHFKFDTHRMQQNSTVHRLPRNPDGTRGFGVHRRASVETDNSLQGSSPWPPQACC